MHRLERLARAARERDARVSGAIARWGEKNSVERAGGPREDARRARTMDSRAEVDERARLVDAVSDAPGGGGEGGGGRRWGRALAGAACAALACAAALAAVRRGEGAGGVSALGYAGGAGAPRRARATARAGLEPKEEVKSKSAPATEETPPEYACATKKKAEREAALASRMGKPVSVGCEESDGKSCSPVSSTAARLGGITDHVYILCMHCDRVKIPPEWEGAVTTVHGGDVDLCYGRLWADHWHKASTSHVHAFVDAVLNKYETITIMEEDALTADPREIGPETFDVEAILQFLRDDKSWNTVRLGYRPYFLEEQSIDQIRGGATDTDVRYRCPEQCACETIADGACMIKEGACDMRSSDFYLLRTTQVPYLRRAIGGGSTIDMEALRRIKRQVYILPQLSYQSHLDRSRQQQVNMARRFKAVCARYVEPLPSAVAEQEYEESST